eukprot:3940291-Rhodomonas_salina.2
MPAMEALCRVGSAQQERGAHAGGGGLPEQVRAHTLSLSLPLPDVLLPCRVSSSDVAASSRAKKTAHTQARGRSGDAERECVRGAGRRQQRQGRRGRPRRLPTPRCRPSWQVSPPPSPPRLLALHPCEAARAPSQIGAACVRMSTQTSGMRVRMTCAPRVLRCG